MLLKLSYGSAILSSGNLTPGGHLTGRASDACQNEHFCIPIGLQCLLQLLLAVYDVTLGASARYSLWLANDANCIFKYS